MRADEVQGLIDEGIFKNFGDWNDMKYRAEQILPHRCEPRCLMKVGVPHEPDSYKCRKLNNLKVSPDNTKHCFIPISTSESYTTECIQKLIDIGLVYPRTINEHGFQSEFKSVHPFFHPVRHIPPTNPTHDMNISPVEGKTFAALKSMQNVQIGYM